jgi:flavorubredoxin
MEVLAMKAIVVYESHWGNTAQVARAVAAGIGPEARALTTTEATPEIVASADLLVAGAPVMAFGLPSDTMLRNAAADRKAPAPADVSHPSLRRWLDRLPHGHGQVAAFDTRISWSPRGATGTIESKLRQAGYTKLARGEKFVVKSAYGPLREGELDRAREWGGELAAAMR